MQPIRSLPAKQGGIQFAVYSDSTSGRPDRPNAMVLGLLNRMVAQLSPAPDFILFPGDQIGGARDIDEHRQQWRYFIDTEMAPIHAAKIPVYHSTSNHVTFLPEHDPLFREIFPEIPANGPPGEEGLEYWVRHGDALIVNINMHSPRRGYGRIETEWLDRILAEQHDARYKIVCGHLPVFTVNGYGFMNCHREDGRKFWDVLVKHGVQMYVCSHVLAFDVQLHRGVIQLMSGCASGYLMPASTEYSHFVQVAMDDDGVRFQTIDIAGCVREWSMWPLREPSMARIAINGDPAEQAQHVQSITPGEPWAMIWKFSGVVPPPAEHPQTLLSGLFTYAVVFEEASMRLGVYLQPHCDAAWERWKGPRFEPGMAFSFEVMLYSGFGPGGVFFRRTGEAEWESMETKSARGLDQFRLPRRWMIGRGTDGEDHDRWIGELPAVEWSYPITVSRELVIGNEVPALA